jgi:serine/alanine adding enzyme
MNIVNIKKESDLNSFIASQANSQFLQSWQWGEFQNKVAGETFRWAVIDNNEILATAILVKKTLPMGKSYFFCPRGPVFQANSNKAAVVKFLFEEIIKIAKAEGVIFMRFEPAEKDSISACPLPIEDTIDIEP